MKRLLLSLALLSSSVVAYADAFTSQCSNLFSSPLHLNNDNSTQELCNNEFAVLYSYKSKTPLFSYEKHNTNYVMSTIKRSGSFKEDDRLPLQYRVYTKDYVHSGYDRGHLTPSADASTLQSQQDTFLLSNIAPQASKLNQGPWAKMERATYNFEYKVTGVLFQGSHLQSLSSGILVPTQFYKIVSDGKTCSDVYIADNTPTAQVERTTYDNITKLSGVQFNLPEKECSPF